MEVNRRSPAAYLNEDRFAQGRAAGRAPTTARRRAGSAVAENGRYDWHDHRIHWMGEGTLPPQVEDEGERAKVFDWTIPMASAGRPVTVRGTLTWLGKDEGGFPVAAAVSLGGSRSSPRRAAGGASCAAGARGRGAGQGGVVRAATHWSLALAAPPALRRPGRGRARRARGRRPSAAHQVDAAPEAGGAPLQRAGRGGFGAVRVFDAEGERVDEGDPCTLAATLDAVGVGAPRRPPDGSYTATFRVVSADSHPVSGGFVFTVGEGGAAPAPASPS